ncbi:MAG: MASE1 domain-containing protein [Pseudomonadota bacterium]
MTHPRSDFGASPSRGRRQRTGEAGPAAATGLRPLDAAQTPPAGPLPAAAMVGYLVLYLLLDWVSYVHPMRGTNITAWNPQAALAVALLARSPRHWWLVACSLVLAAVARGLPQFSPADTGASLMLTLGYAATAAALRHWLGAVPWVANRKAYLVFLLSAVAGAALNAALYVGSLGLFGAAPLERLPAAFMRGWVGDAVSLVVTLPVVAALAHRRRRSESAAMLLTLEWWLVCAAALLAAYAVFARPTEDQFKFFYLLFLPVAWGAARFGTVGAVWAAAAVQGLLILAVQGSPYQPLTVFELHMLMAALGATGLLLGATVDEREQAEQALRASLHAAAAADMAAALAHELNQPLTALRSYARATQLMAQQAGPAQQAGAGSLADVTTKLVGEVNRAGEVVKRLRDFFRQRGTELHLTPMAPLVDAVLQSQAVRARSAGVALQAQCDPALPPVWMDRVQIEVVLRNLVSNALDAASQRPDPHPFVRVDATLEAGRVLVAVRDSGAGVSAEELPQVFESRRSSKPGGMGIGLKISRSIIEAHEGRLWAEPGPGGHFFFTLPLAATEEAAE